MSFSVIKSYLITRPVWTRAHQLGNLPHNARYNQLKMNSELNCSLRLSTLLLKIGVRASTIHVTLPSYPRMTVG